MVMVSILRKPAPLPSINAKYFGEGTELTKFFDSQIDEVAERRQIASLKQAYYQIEWESYLAERKANEDRYRIMGRWIATGEVEVVDYESAAKDALEAVDWYSRYWGDGWEIWFDDTRDDGKAEGN